MKGQPEKYGRDWVAVPKRRIYALTSAVLLSGAMALVLLNAYVYGNTFGPKVAGAERAVAFVLTAEGNVTVFRATTRQAERATQQTRLQAGDTVQTDGTGSVRVSMADGSILSVNENSVITISDNAAAKTGDLTTVRVAIARGLISMQTEQQSAGAANTIITPLTNNRIRAHTRASFGVYEDRTEDIRVSKGRVEMATGTTAVTTAIAGGEYVGLDRTGAITRREPLLDAPTPFAPLTLTTLSMSGDTPVTLRWSRPEGARADSYQIQIALSPFFVPGGIVLERTDLRLPHLVLDQPRAGLHFWRVRARTRTGQLSEWSEPMKFTVTGEPVATPRRKPAGPEPAHVTRGPQATEE
jgi:hypothetical protein